MEDKHLRVRLRIVPCLPNDLFDFLSSLGPNDQKAISRAAYGLMLKGYDAYLQEQALAFEETSRMVAHDLIHGTGRAKRGRGHAKSTRVSGNARAPQPRLNDSGLGDGDDLNEADPSPPAATGEQALGGVPNVAEEPSSRAQEHTAASAKESARAQGHEFARELMLSGALSVYTGKK